MPAPNRLLHPIPVFIEQVNKRFTAYDEILKEPIGEAKREKPIRLVAQLSIGDTLSPSPVEGGVNENSAGYCLFLTSDLRKAEVEIKRGDKIVQIGEGANSRQTELFFTKFQWRGHYPSAGGPTLLKAFFQDRAPSE